MVSLVNMSTQQKRKRDVCMLQKKLKVPQWLYNGESAQKLPSELGIGVTTIKDWRKIESILNHIS